MADNGIVLILKDPQDTFQLVKIGDEVAQLPAPIIPFGPA